jgi:uncharacterized protein (TIGR02001 family)
LTVLSPLVAAPAMAQVAVSVSADSDDRFRGVSLSDSKPVLSATIAWDHASGAYAGGSVIGVEGPASDPQALGYVVYVGLSERVNTGLAWDVGVTNSHYTEPTSDRYTVDYTEVFAGLVADNFSARLYFSPSYFGDGAQTLYLDVDGAVRPARHWRLFGHLGALTTVGGVAGLGSHRAYLDARAGVAFEFRSCELRLAWTVIGPEPDYPSGYPQGRDALVVGATYAF